MNTHILNCATRLAWLAAAGAAAQAQQPTDAMIQGHQFCGTVVTDAQIAAESLWQSSGVFDGIESRGPGAFRYIRVAIHIVRQSNGTNGVTKGDIQIGISEANAEFAPSNIVFIPVYQDFIDSDTYATLTDAEGDSLRQVNSIPGMLNLYFVPSAPYCGQSTFPAGVPGSDNGPQGIIIQNSCAALGGVVAHEIGHYYSLYHTHETGFGADCPIYINCYQLGDLVCDTPPDPGLHNCTGDLGSCVDNCEYTGTARCGNATYAPNVNNTMSYTDPECMTGFSAGQNARIAGAIGLADRVDEIAFNSDCGRPVYVQSSITVGLGMWAAPDGGLRVGINRAVSRCNSGGVVIAIRGNYHEGTAVYNSPVTIVASREGSGDVVIRP